MFELTSYQYKTDCYNFKAFYVNLTVIAKQNPVVDIQKIKRESQHTIPEEPSNQNREQDKKEQRNYSQRAMNKMAASPNLSGFHYTWANFSRLDTEGLNGRKNKSRVSAGLLHRSGHTQAESEGVEKGVPLNRNQKRTGVDRRPSDKTAFKTKTKKEYHYVIIKGSI